MTAVNSVVEALGFDMMYFAKLIAYSVFIGAALGVLFDLFRISRVFLSLPDAGVFKKASDAVLIVVCFVEDLLFFILAALTIVIFVFHANHGTVRGFILLGTLSGFFLYLSTVGRLTMWSASGICRFLRRLIFLLGKKIVFPILRAVFRFASFLYRKTLGRLAAYVWLAYRRKRSRRMARELMRLCAQIKAR